MILTSCITLIEFAHLRHCLQNFHIVPKHAAFCHQQKPSVSAEIDLPDFTHCIPYHSAEKSKTDHFVPGRIAVMGFVADPQHILQNAPFADSESTHMYHPKNSLREPKSLAHTTFRSISSKLPTRFISPYFFSFVLEHLVLSTIPTIESAKAGRHLAFRW